MVNDVWEKKLAKISEEENYAAKNAYVHKNRVLQFQDKSKMPIDEQKVKDILRNQHIVRDRMNSEIGTYQEEIDKPNYDHGLLTYINEAAYGEMRDLIRDVGVTNENIPYYSTDRIKGYMMKNSMHESDRKFQYLVNAMFTPVDMTDQEESFVGWNEVGDDLPIHDFGKLEHIQDERHPQINMGIGIEVQEKRPQSFTTEEMDALIKEKYADKPEEPELEYGAEEADYDEEYDEEGDEEGGDEEEDEYGEEGGDNGMDDYYAEIEDKEDKTWGVDKEPIPHVALGDRYFIGDKADGLRGSFNDAEIGAFMKVLNVKPYNQWEDKNTYHYKLGTHTYEDEAQELDPEFHVLSEPERKEAEKLRVREWRSGAEVRFEVGTKRPVHYQFRF